MSPVLSTSDRWRSSIDDFWDAWRLVFYVPQPSNLCGSHVHVSPSPAESFSLSQLRRVAYGVVFYEPFVQQLLPVSRRTSPYCKPNTKHSDALRRIMLSSHCTECGLAEVWEQILDSNDRESLRDLMQHSSTNQDDRRVLWNFDNVFMWCSGTVEFRGGHSLMFQSDTKMWISLAVAFVHLCLCQVCIPLKLQSGSN